MKLGQLDYFRREIFPESLPITWVTLAKDLLRHLVICADVLPIVTASLERIIVHIGFLQKTFNVLDDAMDGALIKRPSGNLDAN